MLFSGYRIQVYAFIIAAVSPAYLAARGRIATHVVDDALLRQ